MLGLAEIESEVAAKEETSAIPVPDKVFGSMRRCTAGIIIVSAEEGNKDADGNYRVNENLLIEIGAAFVLYDRRVVLLRENNYQSHLIYKACTGANLTVVNSLGAPECSS